MHVKGYHRPLFGMQLSSLYFMLHFVHSGLVEFGPRSIYYHGDENFRQPQQADANDYADNSNPVQALPITFDRINLRSLPMSGGFYG